MARRYKIAWNDPRYFDIDDNSVIPFSEFVDAYLDCRRKKRRKISAVDFELNWEKSLYELYEDVRDGTYTIGESVTFITTRPKKREVFAASFRDRIIHHLVCRKIEPLLEDYFIEDTYNCRVGKGTSYGIERLHEKIRQVSNNYTSDCWIARFDMQGFFMSIHKPTLWKMLEAFLNERYNAPDKEIIMWLTKMIVLHSPEDNCVRKMPKSMWDGLPDNKSLFTNGKDYGLPIGNLSSQMFANFYLTEFDKWMSSQFEYGRYVDDFFVVDTDKKKILDAIPHMREQLAKVEVVLHHDKIYIQHYTKGMKFIGGVSKMKRLYAGNRTIDNFKQAILRLNDIEDKASEAEHAVQAINSYIGFMIHRNSFNKRKEALSLLDASWLDFIRILPDFSKAEVISKQMHQLAFFAYVE